MLRRMKNDNVIGETTVTRLRRSGDAETWLVVETSCEANGPEMSGVVDEALTSPQRRQGPRRRRGDVDQGAMSR